MTTKPKTPPAEILPKMNVRTPGYSREKYLAEYHRLNARRLEWINSQPKEKPPTKLVRPAKRIPRVATGSKREWFNFDEEDIGRVFNALFFRRTSSNLTVFLEPRYRFIRGGYFKTPEKHPETNHGESANIWLTVRDDLKLDLARKYLVYLGFGEPLIKEMLRYYEGRIQLQADFVSWPTVPKKRTRQEAAIDDLKEITIDDPKMYESFSRHSAGLTGEELRPMLTPDEESARKWEARLVRANKTWSDVRLTTPAIASLIKKALKEMRIKKGLELKAIVKRLKRLKPHPMN